ncbi:MAG: ABC transporter substrate-binding protein, partial [Dehalococcoidales bacterium]|nr:ABC transporter substrate-binding protein [Dehalococcoidales bacterium]
QDWRNSVGTGPFMLTDFVSNSQATYVRNPNYWMKNPVGPGEGDQLPYLDGAKSLIIPDTATQVAAFRTGKLDMVGGFLTQMGDVLNDPKLAILSKRFISDSPAVLGMRTDMADSPFSKKDVRQAIMYALDLKAVKDKYYMGDAELVTWPFTPAATDYKDLYVPLEELPANVQALYAGPNVAKAKELLAKAGYPNGFKANVICNSNAIVIDLMSMFQADLAKVNINLTMDVKDQAIWATRMSARNYGAYDFMYMLTAGVGSYPQMKNTRGTAYTNISYINDPVVNAAYQEMQKYVGIDEKKCMQINHDLTPYLLEQCYVITLPSAYIYIMWWPWVKDYHGEFSVGYYNSNITCKYTWLDQALKKQMTGQ